MLHGVKLNFGPMKAASIMRDHCTVCPTGELSLPVASWPFLLAEAHGSQIEMGKRFHSKTKHLAVFARTNDGRLSCFAVPDQD